MAFGKVLKEYSLLEYLVKTMKTTITVEQVIHAPVEKVWEMWITPSHIVQWCHASDDWEAPDANNDARVDGTINIEMSTVLQNEKGGGIRIEVLNLGAKVSENQVHKINIPIRILTETGKAVEDAMKAKAEAEKAVAEKTKRMTR